MTLYRYTKPERGHIMVSRSLLRTFIGCALLLSIGAPQASAYDEPWDGSAGTNVYGTAANWMDDFVPQFDFDMRAVIGHDDTAPLTDPNAFVLVGGGADPPDVAGLVFGLRERDENTGVFLNPAPAPGQLVGKMRIENNRVYDVRPGGTTPGAPTNGEVFVGVDGRGELTINNATLNARGLTVAGEEYTDGTGLLHRSFVRASGTSTVNVSSNLPGTVNLNRDVRIDGPSVNWNSNGRMTMGSTSRYTAGITSATNHSAIKTNNIAVLNGSINVEFSGAGASGHAIGESWDLFRGANGIAGGFNNLAGFNREVPVTGLASPNPVGTGYVLRTVAGIGESGGSPTEFMKTVQLVYQAYLVLEVNRDTGQMLIKNPHNGNIGIDLYHVYSDRGSLLTGSGFHGIHGDPNGAEDPGWVFPANNTANILTEFKGADFTPPNVKTDAFNLLGNSQVEVGQGFSRTAVGNNVANFGQSGEDLVFEYTGPNGGVIRGPVTYVGNKFNNNLVLQVNPTTGNAWLKNDSSEILTFDGYEVLSTTSSLNWGTWTGIGGGWQKSPADDPNTSSENSLTNTNPTGSITLNPTQRVFIGDIGAFGTPAIQNGVSMNFILKVGLEGDITPGDFDEDGDVDGSDFLLWQRGGSPTPLSQADLTAWGDNYGTTGGGFAPEVDFRPGTVVFDNAFVPPIAPVPEPCAAALMLMGMGMFAGRRRRAAPTQEKQMASAPVPARSNQLGARTMSRRIGLCVTALALVGAVVLTSPAAEAATGGATMTNVRFEQPGPAGVKQVAFDPNGIPVPGAIPGWTFVGPGQETFGDPNNPGDSGTEGGGNPGNEMLLSTLDGIVYQTSSTVFFPAGGIPATQQYVFSFDAHDIFTINADGSIGYTNQQRNRLSGRITWGDARNDVIKFNYLPTGPFQRFEIVLPYNSPLVTAALNQKVGIEFDNTSIEYDANAPADPNNQFNVGHAWAGVDNVFLEITGVTPGDLDGNGVVNLVDYGIIRDNQQKAADYLAQGDLIRDGIVDLRDFRAWTLLPSVISSGVLEKLNSVPEPSSLALMMVVAASATGFARRGRRARALMLALVVLCGVSAAAPDASAALLLYDPIRLGPDPNVGDPNGGFYELGQVAPLSEAEGSVGNQSPRMFNDPDATLDPNSDASTFLERTWKRRQSDAALDANVQAAGLSFLGAPSGGGAIAATGNARVGRYMTTPWDNTTVGTFYIGYLINYGQGDYINDTPEETGAAIQGEDMGFRAVEMWSAGGEIGNDGTYGVGVGYSTYNGLDNNRQPGTARMFLRVSGGPGDQIIDNSPASFMQDNSTHLVVLKFTFSATANQDRVQLFLDPTENEEPVIPNAEVTNLTLTIGAIGSVVRFGGSGTSPVFDELRVGTTFSDVIPDFPLKGDCCGAGPSGGNPDGPDDRVDIEDYNVIVANMNLTGRQSWQGDVTGDGRVSAADWRLWKDNRTDIPNPHPPLSEMVNVPEPSCMAIALLGALAFGCARRKN